MWALLHCLQTGAHPPGQCKFNDQRQHWSLGVLLFLFAFFFTLWSSFPPFFLLPFFQFFDVLGPPPFKGSLVSRRFLGVFISSRDYLGSPVTVSSSLSTHEVSTRPGANARTCLSTILSKVWIRSPVSSGLGYTNEEYQQKQGFS